MNDNFFEYRGRIYPKIVREHFSSQYIIPLALKFCKGKGVDIGCGKQDWTLPGASPVDPAIGTRWDAYTLPCVDYDYIFSSHCLEHLEDQVGALRYWYNSLRPGGILFLYLPHPDQEYWSKDCPKHIYVKSPEELKRDLTVIGFVEIYQSQRDFNWSYVTVAVKKESKNETV